MESIDVVDFVSSLLDSGKYKEALSVPNDPKYSDSFKDNCWDLISVIVSKIQDDTILLKPSLHSICEDLLAMVVQKATPEEALLEFIEQVEVAKNDAQFSIILSPLQQLLIKLTIKRGRSLEWCLNSISTYIERIPKPDQHLEGKERLLMDSDTNVRRVARIYALLPDFYSPFVKEVCKPDASVRTKQIIAAFLISLLGKPLIYVDLDPETNEKSEARLACFTIMQDICLIEKDICKFLIHLESCFKENQKKKPKAVCNENDAEVMPYEHREKINVTTLSGLFYVVFSGHFQIDDLCIPQVYSIEYIVHTVMLSVQHLLTFVEYSPISKALALFHAILDRLPNDVPSTLLLLPIHFDVCKSLVNVAIYSSFETLRSKSLKLITSHVNKFDYKGRCLMIKYILDTSNHSGMIGYSITLFKNSIDQAFKEPELPSCFTGAQLLYMIKKMYHLPHGVESDLVELADQIISALNLLRYLVLRDTKNVTGIKSSFPDIDSEFLEKLRTGLNMSKAHYEAKLQEIEAGKSSSYLNNVSVNVGGHVLDNIPTKNKKEIIYSALNAFHLIEGLVARLAECMNTTRMQGLTMDCE